MLSKTSIGLEWRKYFSYPQFERIALACILIMIGAITIFTIVFTGIKLVSDMLLGEAFVDKAALQDTLGLILTVLILLEFNHTVFVGLTRRSGAIQVRMLVQIVILVVSRKLMLLDFSVTDAKTLLGFGGLLLALGGLYWLISDGDRRRHRSIRIEDSELG
jgi:uncharacterized membrane protein (DUF373 family)